MNRQSQLESWALNCTHFTTHVNIDNFHAFLWCVEVLRALPYLCYYKCRMSALILLAVYGQFLQEELLLHANQAVGALYANLARPYFARFYGKLLIFQVGT